MTTIQRPNKDTLIKVIDIYRDAMRPFMVLSRRDWQRTYSAVSMSWYSPVSGFHSTQSHSCPLGTTPSAGVKLTPP